jgi:uncharacterized protein
MKVYLDASVILRVVFGEKDALAEWRSIRRAISSELAMVECLRTVDRMRLRVPLDDKEVAERRAAITQVFSHTDRVTVTAPVLERSSQPFPTSLGTLDAIHLASALLWQQSEGAPLVFATHDVELGTAAKAMGMQVIGMP